MSVVSGGCCKRKSIKGYLADIVTTRPFSLPCYLQCSENGRVVTIGKHSRLNRQIWYRHPNSDAGNDEIQNFQRGDFYFVGITNGRVVTIGMFTSACNKKYHI
jgi:hypothetical protein